MTERKRIVTALYGGSFNPIHLGHTQLGEWICKNGYADELWLLVSPLNPLKAESNDTLLPDTTRLHLARLAVQDILGLMVSDFEMSLPRPSFMVHTLEALRKTYPEREFVLVIGADNWLCFSQWRNPEEILRHHRILVYPRSGYDIDPTTLPATVQLVEAPLFPISSTEIRDSIAHGTCDGQWLAPNVWEEIKHQRLYHYAERACSSSCPSEDTCSLSCNPKDRNQLFQQPMKQYIYIFIVAILALSLLAGFATTQFGLDMGQMSWLGTWVSSPIALLLGILFALTFGATYEKFTKLMSKKMLQYSVIGLGFGMNVNAAIASGREGMLFTIASVFGTLGLGYIIGRKLLKVDSQTSYLISSGTAICGGSAIAAVGPTIKARSESMSVALGVVFVLNAIALFIFPYIGDMLGMTMKQFGMWSAIAIHDTSSVVGAGSAYDQMHPELLQASGISALEVATTVKLTRALWIVVLVLATPFFFRHQDAKEGAGKPWYKNIPTFIIWFIVAILVNTYILSNTSLLGEDAASIGTAFSSAINRLAKSMITLSLFFIGAGLTRKTLQAVGFRPLLQGVMLWITISIVSMGYILWVV